MIRGSMQTSYTASWQTHIYNYLCMYVQPAIRFGGYRRAGTQAPTKIMFCYNAAHRQQQNKSCYSWVDGRGSLQWPSTLRTYASSWVRVYVTTLAEWYEHLIIYSGNLNFIHQTPLFQWAPPNRRRRLTTVAPSNWIAKSFQFGGIVVFFSSPRAPPPPPTCPPQISNQ